MNAAIRSSIIEPIPSGLLKEPLVWIFAEHYRHRDLCQKLIDLQEAEAFNKSTNMEILNFMENDLELHIIDEEQDLNPLLRRRCEPDDQIESVLARLSVDHDEDLRLASRLTALLKRSLDEESCLSAYKDAAQTIEKFCQSQKRHIGIENAVVLPIARLRLTANDLKKLGQQMAARRELPDPFEQAS